MPGIEFLDRSHDEAIEQRHLARRSGSGMDASARKELEILQDGEELLLPLRGVLPLDSSQRMGDPPPRVRDTAFVMAAAGVPILRFPDVVGNIGGKMAHSASDFNRPSECIH